MTVKDHIIHKNILGINVDNEFVSRNVEIVNAFNKYLANVASKLKEPIHDTNFEYIKEFVDSKVDNNVSFSIPEINIVFVRKYILNLDISKSTGLDDIGPRILKLSYDIISPSITFLINKSCHSVFFQMFGKPQILYSFTKLDQKKM